MAQLLLTVEEVKPLGPQAHRLTPTPIRPRRARIQRCRTSESHFPICTSTTKADGAPCAAATPRPEQSQWREIAGTHFWSVLSFDYWYVILGLGRDTLSFKLSNLFHNSLQVYAEPSPYPISFLDILGFFTLILSDHFPRFSQARFLPFIVTILASPAHNSAGEFSPYCFSPFLQ